MEHIPNRKILHAIPLSFSIDGEHVYGRPHGMHGTKLEVNSLFVTTFDQHLNDLISSIENIGISVEDVMAAPLAASFVMLTKAQKRAGCVLANIGAETVSIVVFENSTPISLKIFPIGSNDITTDIFELIDAHLRKIKRDGLLPAGIIITGGGSGIATVQDLAKASLRLPSKVATLDPGQNGKVRDASWAVAYGLCMWGANDDDEENGVGIAKKAKHSLLQWFSQFLP